MLFAGQAALIVPSFLVLHRLQHWISHTVEHVPLTRQGELAGFVRLGAKRSQDVYRPDQVDRVARAVRQVGFDLYALRPEQAAGRAGVRAAPAEGLVAPSA